MRRFFIGMIVAFVTAAGAAGQAPQDAAGERLPDVTYTVDVNYVEVDAVVTDAAGRPVRGLIADDFELYEDGKRQEIGTVSFIDLPIAAAASPAVVRTPDLVSNAGEDGRLYMLVMDDLHTGASRTGRIRRAARTFVEHHLGHNDHAAVVFTGGRDIDGQDFTNDKRLLLAAIDRFIGQKLQSITSARIRVFQNAPAQNALPPTQRPGRRTPQTPDPNDPNSVEFQPDDPLAYERSTRARLVMARVRQMAELMSSVRGRRKALVLLSEGVEYDIDDALGSSAGDAVAKDTDDAIAAATRGNVSIYAIDPRGLEPGPEELLEASSSGSADQTLGMPSLRRELQMAHASLRYLAEGTGGFSALNTSNFSRAFERIVRENSSYYLVGFSPDNSRQEGQYRRIDVRVTRPGLRVSRSRDGYRERRPSRPTTLPAVAAAANSASFGLTSPLPLRGIPLQVFAGTYRAVESGSMVALAIEVDVSTLHFDSSGDRFTQELDVAYLATDAHGAIRQHARQVVEVSLTEDRIATAKREGIRIITGLALKPGRYQLRVAVGERGGRVGSVIHDLDIADFSAAPLAMSSISLTSVFAKDAPTTTRSNFLSLPLRGPVTARREFSRRDEITIYAEVYQQMARTRHLMELRTRARSASGNTVYSVVDELWARERATPGTYMHTARIPIEEFPPGDYVVEMEARAHEGPVHVVKREIAIRVND